MEHEQPTILFDGFCNLCNGAVNFLLKRDRKKQFVFTPLQSEAGKLLKQKFTIADNLDSVILIKAGVAFFKSDAAFEIMRMLPYPLKIAVCLKLVPKKIRDKLYDWIAKNRYRWFGKRETCMIPEAEKSELFHV